MAMVLDLQSFDSSFTASWQSRVLCGPGACAGDEYGSKDALLPYADTVVHVPFALTFPAEFPSGILTLVKGTTVNFWTDEQGFGDPIPNMPNSTFDRSDTTAGKEGELSRTCAARVITAISITNEGIYRQQSATAGDMFQIPVYALAAEGYYECGLLRLAMNFMYIGFVSDLAGCRLDLGAAKHYVGDEGIRGRLLANNGNVSFAQNSTLLACFLVWPNNRMFDEIFGAMVAAHGASLPAHPTSPPTIAGTTVAPSDSVVMRLGIKGMGFLIPAVWGTCNVLAPSEQTTVLTVGQRSGAVTNMVTPP